MVTTTALETWRQTGFDPGASSVLFGASALVIPSTAPDVIKDLGEQARRRIGDRVRVCDGKDDDVDIQAAIDAIIPSQNTGGGSVMLLDGAFTLGDTIEIRHYYPGLVLFGQGWGTILYPRAGTYAFQLGRSQIADQNAYQYGAQFRDFYISGRATAYGASGFDIQDGDHILLANIRLRYLTNCIMLLSQASHEVNAITMRDLWLEDFTTYGIAATYAALTCGQNRIYDCRITQGSSSGGKGIYFANTFGTIIRGCVFEQADRHIQIDAGRVNVIENCHFVAHTAATDFSLYLKGGQSVVRNCDFNDYHKEGASDAGIYVGTESSWSITDCDLRGITTGYSVFAEGYGNGRGGGHAGTHFSHNLYSPSSGVLEDAQIEQYLAVLGFGRTSVYDTIDQSILWTFNEGSGVRVYDISGTLIGGQLINGPVWGEYASGWGKVTLDGTNDYIKYPAVTLEGATPSPNLKADGSRTFIWAGMPDFAFSENTARYFWLWESASNNRIYLRRDAANSLQAVYNSAGSSTTLTANSTNMTFAADEPMIFILVCDVPNTTAHLYVNGALVDSDTITAISSANGRLWLGADDTPGSYYDGDIGLFAMIPRTFAQAEIHHITESIGHLISGSDLGLHGYASMSMHENANATAIQAVNDWHLIRNFSTGSLSPLWSFTAGAQKAITAYADNGDGKTVVTSNGHGMLNGHVISISGTTSYDGVWVIEQKATNTFVIPTAFVADDGASTAELGDWLESTENQQGVYRLLATISLTSAGANDVMELTAYINATQQTQLESQMRLGAAGDYVNMVLSGFFTYIPDAHITLAIRNLTDGDDITIRDANLSITKVEDE